MREIIIGLVLAIIVMNTGTLVSSSQLSNHGFPVRKEESYSSPNYLNPLTSETQHEDKNFTASERILRHKITDSDIERLRAQVGVWQEGKNYTQKFNGHGTGFRPPTEEEWRQITDNSYVVDRILLEDERLIQSSVDHTTTPWFPPIGNQGGEGSCTAWAVGYYMKTFQEAKEHNWDLSGAVWEGNYPSIEYQDRIISPDFIYHLTNNGTDGGSCPETAINLICSIGASSWEKMPYDQNDHTSWPAEDAWREASLYRGNSSGVQYMYVSDDQGLENLKNWIALGNLAAITVDASKISNLLGSLLTSDDMLTLDNYSPPWGESWHEVTVVGYDDSFEYTEEGETRYGAFKIANSWGIGGGLFGWEHVPDGCFWISYEVIKQRIGRCEFYHDRVGYNPELVASFRIQHSKRDECAVTVGVGSQAKAFTQYIYGGDQPFCSNKILFDITEFKELIPDPYGQQFYIKVHDGGSSTTGYIVTFAVEHMSSADPPIATINGGNVYAYATLFPLDTKWRSEQQVGLDNDFLDGKVSMATDSNGYLYVAYEDWYPLGEQYGIFVHRSTDGGNTWSDFFHFYWVFYECHNPSIAIDPNDNRIYVAYERGNPGSEHDIYCGIYTQGIGQNHVGVDIDSENDRYPSITSEYQYGTNWQYISYEYVYTHNDRDLMFAKSTDHGITWSTKKLHGNWPDYNVHAQTSITNAEGYLYIAYKWGANYDTPCEIRVERSTDFGNTWTLYTDIDGSTNGCSFPSIAAVHGGSTVMVAFQYDWSTTDIDIRYSWSTDKGANWVKGYSLFYDKLENEKLPMLTVDGGGSTRNDIGGNFHIICKVGSFLRYGIASYLLPYSWNTSAFISERWAGKGLAITTRYQEETAEFHPYVSWSDERTNDIFCSTIGHVHNLNTGLTYDSIQEAIDANETLNGHTIFVESRIYYEHLYVNKSISLIGQNRENTIVDGLHYSVILEIVADDVVLANLSVRNGNVGISLSQTSNLTILGNNITHCDFGINLQSCYNSTIQGNIVSNTGWGIHLSQASNNSILGNNITHCELGVYMLFSRSNILRNNRLFGSKKNFGIAGSELSDFINDIDSSNRINNKPVYYLINQKDIIINNSTFPNAGFLAVLNSTNVIVQDLKLDVNLQGLLFVATTNSTITGNTLTNNTNGIGLVDSSNISIIENSIVENYYGISLQNAVNNTLSGNRVEGDPANRAIYLYNSFNNSIYHNNFLTYQVYSYNSVNMWDNGYPSGGNYWSNYAGGDIYHGPNQNELGCDGIGDSPYAVDINNEDNYPLMNPWPGFPSSVRFVPEIVEFEPDIVVGQNLTVACVIEDVTQLYGFDIRIYWDPSWLSYVSHTLTIPFESYPDPISPSLYGGILHAPTLLVADVVDVEAGTYEVAACGLGGPAFDGNGTVFIVTFQVVQQPVAGEEDMISIINFTNSDLADINARPIFHMICNEIVVIPALRNIAISNVTPSKTIVGGDYSIYINVTVENHGVYSENFEVTIYANTTMIQKANMTLSGLNSTTVMFSWNTTGFSRGNYSIIVTATPVPGETYMVDNTAIYEMVFMTIPGDVDGDRDVDIFDIVAMAGAYGSHEGDPSYNPNYDLDGDGDIDIFDIVAACRHYGESW